MLESDRLERPFRGAIVTEHAVDIAFFEGDHIRMLRQLPRRQPHRGERLFMLPDVGVADSNPQLRVAEPRRQRAGPFETGQGGLGPPQLRVLDAQLVMRLRVVRLVLDLPGADSQVRLALCLQQVATRPPFRSDG